MPYLTGPYAHQTSLPSPARPTIYSARNIDFATQRYTIDTSTGGYDAMQSTRQRVLLAVAFGAGERPSHVDDRQLEARSQRIIAALDDLVADGSIADVSVSFEHPSPGVVRERVNYRNLQTGTDDSAEV